MSLNSCKKGQKMKYVIFNTLRYKYLSEDFNDSDFPTYWDNDKTFKSSDWEHFECNAKKFYKTECQNIVKMLNTIYRQGTFEAVEIEE